MRTFFYLFLVGLIVPNSSYADSFFGLEIETTMSAFKAKNGKQISKCENRHKFSSEIRLNSEITGKHDDDEGQTPTEQIECSFGEGLNAYFVKIQSEVFLWKISKWKLDKSISKVVRDMESKTNTKIEIKSESVNENMGVQYTFKVPFAGGEVRGRAVSPYSKRRSDEVTMADSGEVELILLTPLKEILSNQKRKDADLKQKERSKINTGESGI